MEEMDLLTKMQCLACAKCEDMMDCDNCNLMDEAVELYHAIREKAIEDFKNFDF